MTDTLGSKIDTLCMLREKKRKLEKQAEAVKLQMDLLEQELIKQMELQGVTKSTGELASVSVTPQDFPQVKDWDALYAYIHRVKAYHLLQRRPAVAAFRELFELRRQVPGVEKYTETSLSLRVNGEI